MQPLLGADDGGVPLELKPNAREKKNMGGRDTVGLHLRNSRWQRPSLGGGARSVAWRVKNYGALSIAR